MNIERLTTLRNFLAQLPANRFVMSDWMTDDIVPDHPTPEEVVHNCGTCACIGGWAGIVFFRDEPNLALYEAKVAEVLGLSLRQAHDLFFPKYNPGENGFPYDGHYADVQLEDALIVLDKLIETGVVDWSHMQS